MESSSHPLEISKKLETNLFACITSKRIAKLNKKVVNPDTIDLFFKKIIELIPGIKNTIRVAVTGAMWREGSVDYL